MSWETFLITAGLVVFLVLYIILMPREGMRS
jgi:hypothetical protein